DKLWKRQHVTFGEEPKQPQLLSNPTCDSVDGTLVLLDRVAVMPHRSAPNPGNQRSRVVKL
ncbi:unnamed protein product, partial [Amoebophrya sp. A25]